MYAKKPLPSLNILRIDAEALSRNETPAIIGNSFTSRLSESRSRRSSSTYAALTRPGSRSARLIASSSMYAAPAR